MKGHSRKPHNHHLALCLLLLLLCSACRPYPVAPAPTPAAVTGTAAPATLSPATATARPSATAMVEPETATAAAPTAAPATATHTATKTTVATATVNTQPTASLSPPVVTPAPVPGPQITHFSANAEGEGVLLTWEAGGGSVSVCPVVAGDPLSCNCLSDLPPKGTARVSAAEIIGTLSGFALTVSDGDRVARAETSVAVACPNQNAWFFADPPAMCPRGDPLYSAAAAQPFAHGQMIWLEATDTYYLLYDRDLRVAPAAGTSSLTSLGIISGPLNLKPGASVDNRIGETPPAGLFEPVSGFGLLWRGEVVGTDHVRAALGWATAPEFAFNSSYQCAHHCGASWNCYLLAPDGGILHLTYLLHFGDYWDRY